MTDRPYTVLAFGDSVVWGQGLKPEDRFVTKVAARMAASSGREPLVISLAHSGAAIRSDRKTLPFREASSSKDHTYGGEKLFIHGDIGQLHPTIHTQLRIAAGERGYAGYLDPHPTDAPEHAGRKEDLKRGLATLEDPDLIILDGGGNDFDPLRVFAPFRKDLVGKPGSAQVLEALEARALGMTDTSFDQLAERHFRKGMAGLLSEVRKRWPSAPIVVTGYYPVFTEGSFVDRDDAAIPLMLYAFLRMEGIPRPSLRDLKGQLEAYAELGKDFLVERSARFDRLQRRHLAESCQEAHRDKAPVLFADPEFGPDNGAFAREAWLYGWKPLEIDLGDFPDIIDVLPIGDPMEERREEIADRYLKAVRAEMTVAEIAERRVRAYRNAVAHPNAAGAAAYAEAVMSVLQDFAS